MTILNDLREINKQTAVQLAKANAEIEICVERMCKLTEAATLIKEDVDFSKIDMRPLYDKMDAAIKMMSAAKRGIGLVNKLPAGESKGKHMSRIFKNLNSIRRYIKTIEKEMVDQAKTSEPISSLFQ